MKHYCFDCHKRFLFFNTKHCYKKLISKNFEIPRGFSTEDCLCNDCYKKRHNVNQYRYRKPVNVKKQTALMAIPFLSLIVIALILASYSVKDDIGMLLLVLIGIPVTIIVTIPFHRIRRKRDAIMYASLFGFATGSLTLADQVFPLTTFIGAIIFFIILIRLVRSWSKQWNDRLPKREASTLIMPVKQKQNVWKIIGYGILSAIIPTIVGRMIFGTDTYYIRYPDHLYPAYFQSDLQFLIAIIIGALILVPITIFFIKKYNKDWEYNFPQTN